MGWERPKVDPHLRQLLRQAAKHKMTPREIWQQRISFVYGQLMDARPDITREEVERHCTEFYGRCPKDPD